MTDLDKIKTFSKKRNSVQIEGMKGIKNNVISKNSKFFHENSSRGSFDISSNNNCTVLTTDEKDLENETEEIEKRTKTPTLPLIEKKIYTCNEYVNNIENWNPTGYISHEST